MAVYTYVKTLSCLNILSIYNFVCQLCFNKTKKQTNKKIQHSLISSQLCKSGTVWLSCFSAPVPGQKSNCQPAWVFGSFGHILCHMAPFILKPAIMHQKFLLLHISVFLMSHLHNQIVRAHVIRPNHLDNLPKRSTDLRPTSAKSLTAVPRLVFDWITGEGAYALGAGTSSSAHHSP